jgi:hypothetical protein
MARIVSALARVRRTILDDLPIESQIDQLCRRHGHTWRDRLLPPLVTLRLFLLQILHGNTAIAHLRQLSGLCFTPAAYCMARMRLPLAALDDLLGWVIGQAQRSADGLSLIGQRIFIADCSSFSMPDTPQLRRHFGRPGGRRMVEGVAYPVAKLLGLMDAGTGMFCQLLAMPLFTHDLRQIISLHETLRLGDILLGDRAYCSYAHLALLHLGGVFGCFRLHQRRKGQRQSGIVTWKRPPKPPTWMSKQQFLSLPATLVVRLVSYRIDRPGFRSDWITIATTLLDEQQWPDEKIRELYARRWGIETCFAHLKTTLKMNVLKCKSVDGVMRELAVYLLVYNLVRLVMLRAAQRQRVDVRRISFADAWRWLISRALGLAGVAELIINPLRPGRLEPRVIRRRMKEYDLMKRPRATLRAELRAGKEVTLN